MTTTMNRPALETLAAHLLANTDTHDQSQFGVRTAAGEFHCVATKALLLESYTLAWCDIPTDDPYPEFSRQGLPVTAIAGSAYTPVTERRVDIAEEAVALLGLTDPQGYDLFLDQSDTDGIVAHIKRLLNEAA